MHLEALTLPTRDLAAQRTFYADTLGFATRQETPHRLTVRLGSTRLTFWQEDSFDGFTHLACDIPRNRVDEAQDWLNSRVPLLADQEGLTCFPPCGNWNTTNLYFEDAAGNILEFIARHDLPHDSAELFGPGSVLHVSELGVVVPDVPAAVWGLGRQFGLRPFNGVSDTFTAVGGHDGMLIVVPQGREWFPTRRPAVPVPFQVTFGDALGPSTLNQASLEAPRCP